MGLMSKFKNMFTEEIEDEPIKKEVIQVEIPAPTKTEKFFEKKEEVKPHLEEKKEPLVSAKEEKFTFPVFFDDTDFETIEKQKAPVKTERTSVERKIEPYTGGRAEPQKEVKKVFKPTPVISPIYGVLDENYKKEDITFRKETNLTSTKGKDIGIDEIRKKAYGTLEDDLENSLLHDDIYDKPAVFREEKDMFDDLGVLAEDDYFMDPLVEEKKTRENSKKTNFEDNMVAQELNQPEEKEEEKDLFELIDSMYKKGDE